VGERQLGSAPARAGSVTEQGSQRPRAVGTRDKIVAHLARVAEVTDNAGMASTRLAADVGYPGSSVAFAQLLSGMERDGLIAREVRGKRTYRITLTPQGKRRARAAADGVRATGASRMAGIRTRGGAGRRTPGRGRSGSALSDFGVAGDFDYDELARRLLVQLVRRLAEGPEGLADIRPGYDQASLEGAVAGLEHELALAWTRHGTLTAENLKLRQQLRETQRDLDRERRARRGVPDNLLDRLLSPAADADGTPN
jgi:DNA-binding MarR family transcriptional regulator